MTTDSTTPAFDGTLEIVSSYVASNAVPHSALPGIIVAVHATLLALGGPPVPTVDTEKPSLAQVRKSIRPDTLVSFLDNRPYKTLRRHLRTYGLTPETYRERFGLPDDYPMVAATYSEQRSALAKRTGLGGTRKAA